MTQKPSRAPAQPPIAKLRLGLIHASVWQNTTEKARFYSVTFERRYKAGNGPWQSTHSYGIEDLLALSKLADQAHTEILKRQAADIE